MPCISFRFGALHVDVNASLDRRRPLANATVIISRAGEALRMTFATFNDVLDQASELGGSRNGIVLTHEPVECSHCRRGAGGTLTSARIRVRPEELGRLGEVAVVMELLAVVARRTPVDPAIFTSPICERAAWIFHTPSYEYAFSPAQGLRLAETQSERSATLDYDDAVAILASYLRSMPLFTDELTYGLAVDDILRLDFWPRRLYRMRDAFTWDRDGWELFAAICGLYVGVANLFL